MSSEQSKQCQEQEQKKRHQESAKKASLLLEGMAIRKDLHKIKMKAQGVNKGKQVKRRNSTEERLYCDEEGKEAVERKVAEGALKERLREYAQNFVNLDYIEEDKNEKDSWHKVSEVANEP